MLATSFCKDIRAALTALAAERWGADEFPLDGLSPSNARRPFPQGSAEPPQDGGRVVVLESRLEITPPSSRLIFFVPAKIHQHPAAHLHRRPVSTAKLVGQP